MKTQFLSGKTEILCRKRGLLERKTLGNAILQRKRWFLTGKTEIFPRKRTSPEKNITNAVLQWKNWFLTGKIEILPGKRGFLVEKCTLHLK